MSTIYSELGLHGKHFYTGETLLTYAEVKRVIDHLLQTEKAIVLGGDVLRSTEKTIDLGGDVFPLNAEYTYDNWYYDPTEDTPWSTQVIQSCEHTLQYIEKLNQPDKKLYILVLQERPKPTR